MKNKIIFLVLIVIIGLVINGMNVYAISFNLDISGDKTVEVDKTIQLKAEYWVGNEIYIPDEPNGGIGEVSREDVTNKSSWTSSNNNIAVVDSNGKVTGVSEGTVTITAKYDIGNENFRNATYEITVKAKSSSDFTGLRLVDKNLTPQPALVLNKEHGFMIYLYNIPDTEKGNIKVTIDNETVAKITGIDLCDYEDGSGKGMIIANAKFLSIGQFTITVTLNYNGKTYSDSYTNGVAESRYTLTLSAKEYTDLPSTLEVGNKIQLTATLGHIGTVLFEDVTTNGVTWTSSDEKVATVDKGLVTAKGEGKVTITAKYTGTDDSVTEKYEINITDSTKSPVNPSSTDSPTTKTDTTTSKTILPQTGEQNILLILLLLSSLIIVTIAYIGYRKYKKIR
jgi:LPXTG-motif cell wall-anchored protein